MVAAGAGDRPWMDADADRRDAAPLAAESRFVVRSYELDGFGHLNHAVYLNWFEQARFEALERGGFTLADMGRRGWGVHVVRVEVDFRREAFLGDELVVRTAVAEARNSSMTLVQAAAPPGEEAMPSAEARVVAVWVGPDRRPIRIPPEVRRALGIEP